MQINTNEPFNVENKVSLPHLAANTAPERIAPPPARVELAEAQSKRLENIRSVLADHSISLKFSTDSTTNSLVVELVDEKTGEAIRQFPSEVSLKLAANFIKLQGNFIDMSE